MLLFRDYHAPLIQDGTKTQTRRLWPHGCRVKVGSIHQCRTRMLDKSSTFAHVKILRVWQERLWDISGANAKAEGYDCPLCYIEAFLEINHLLPNASPLVWVIEWEPPHA